MKGICLTMLTAATIGFLGVYGCCPSNGRDNKTAVTGKSPTPTNQMMSQSLVTQTTLVFSADRRPGAIIFTDECLPRGLTNSMTIAELQTWATNVIEHYNQRPDFRTASLSEGDIPKAVETIQASIPSCRHSYPSAPNDYDVIAPDSNPPTVDLDRDPSGHIESVSISWIGYGAIIGRESFVPKWEHEPWYSRKLAGGVYLWHGYD